MAGGESLYCFGLLGYETDSCSLQDVDESDDDVVRARRAARKLAKTEIDFDASDDGGRDRFEGRSSAEVSPFPGGKRKRIGKDGSATPSFADEEDDDHSGVRNLVPISITQNLTSHDLHHRNDAR